MDLTNFFISITGIWCAYLGTEGLVKWFQGYGFHWEWGPTGSWGLTFRPKISPKKATSAERRNVLILSIIYLSAAYWLLEPNMEILDIMGI